MADDFLRILVIYRRPSDFPLGYVVRGRRVLMSGEPDQVEKGGMVFTAPETPEGDAACLEAARRHCAALGLHRLERSDDDDPVIVETWF